MKPWRPRDTLLIILDPSLIGFSRRRARDGARSDSSETDVRTHHIPAGERVLKKSLVPHSCSFRCCELVELCQRAEGRLERSASPHRTRTMTDDQAS
ncbi:unnamed protein product [Pleuronectes platessa]|uniref:Uncharacterized protein n=1 Tax=Pleuronectes platessa TaxID=8262 RepID=A0A9N7VXU0_PLEPL|nr:unnamed protein product [Pleuronectes platessa]